MGSTVEVRTLATEGIAELSTADRVSQRIYSVHRPNTAFFTGGLIGTLGGMIGLGGAEFRLPLLITVFKLYPHRAIRINLLISLVTLLAAAGARFNFAGFSDLGEFLPIVGMMAVGGVVAAWIGAGALDQIPKFRLLNVIVVLLVATSALLLLEAAGLQWHPEQLSLATTALLVSLVAGLSVGFVSSFLGVAGGEFIIPILVFGFGVDIKLAGTASVLISLPTVLTGVGRHWLEGKYRSRTMLQLLAIPMSVGSILGAVVGAFLAGWAPASLLKALLGAILAISALKLLQRSKT